MAEPQRIRGATPNPLPPGVLLGARMAADRQREQHAEDASERSLNDILGPQEEKVLLEQDPASYAGQSEAQKSTAKQRRMQQTMRQFLADGTETAGEQHQDPLERTEAPRPSRDERAPEQPEQSTPTPDRRAMQLAQAQQRGRVERDTATQEESRMAKGYASLQQSQQTIQRFRRIAEAASIWGSIVLILELNVQCLLTLFRIKVNINTPLFSLTKAGKADMLACLTLDCAVCVNPVMCCPILLVILGPLLGIAGLATLF